jgi:hypothetical protein
MQSSALSANLSNKATGTLPKYNIYGTDDRYMRFMQYEIHNPVNECQTKAIYISEYPNSVKDCAGNQIPIDTFNRSRSFLLLMHFVRDNVIPSEAGSDGSVYAWRLDFYDAQNGIYLDIKRNHTYTFTINKIRSTPYKEDSDGGERMESILNYFPGGQEWQVWDNPGSNIEYTLNVEDDWSKGVFSNGQYAVSVSADTITTDTIPFKIRAIVPDGVDAAQIKVHGFKIVDDNSEVNNQSAIQVTSHTADRGMYVFPADGTTTEVTFEVKDHTLIDDNAYMAIYFGNIRQMIPIKIP